MSTLRQKLDRAVNSQLRLLAEKYEFEVPNSQFAFESPAELRSILAEGSMLNITKIGGMALSVPAGQYLIWSSDKDNTTLIRSEDVSRYQEAFNKSDDTVEIRTKDLIDNYHSVEKVLAEDTQEETSGSTKRSRFGSQKRKVDRTALQAAKENSGMSEEELGDACGVHRSTISRLMRKPREAQGAADPGGRNPSIEVAAKLANVLQTGVESLFPDLLTRKSRKRKSTRKSGSADSGKRKRKK